MQGNGTIIIGIGLAVTGVLLVLTLGSSLFAQPWLLLALTIYAVNLGDRVLHPATEPAAPGRDPAAADDKVWLERAKRQRYVSYAMAALVGTIGFLMSTKPQLW